MSEGAERTERRLSWWVRLGRSLRLRHKLAISLSIAALLPVAVAAWVAVSILLRGLERDLREETEQQLAVGLNLVLRNVERFGHDAIRLSSARTLSTALTEGADEVEAVLADEDPLLPASLVQIADEDGYIVASHAVGEAQRFEKLGVPSKHELIRDGLAYERKVTLVVSDGTVVVRAVAPIVDTSYMLQGVVVLSSPLDGDFADGVKGALGTNVMLSAIGGTASTTFVDETGARVIGLDVPLGVIEHVRRGRTVLDRTSILGGEFAVGYTPIDNLDGETVGVFGVAIDRAPVISARRSAMRSLVLGAAGAFVFALGLAGLLSRRLTRPLGNLHRGAIAIARGDLDHRIEVNAGDEIGDLAEAFTHMTEALKENQQRLAARMRELVALHDAGRAVSSVLSVEQLLRKIVDAVSRVLDVRLCTVWLVDGDQLRIGAGRIKGADLNTTMRGEMVLDQAQPLESIAREVSQARATLRVDRVAEDQRRREAAIAAGVTGSLVATPLERKGTVIGVIIIGRSRDARPFSEAASNLLATFADQAATAIENARLYEEVRAFNEELEEMVRQRTQQLQLTNDELGHALAELRETQSQLILSERLAGLGQLVAGVAHEINSPAAAIRGTMDQFNDNVRRLGDASSAVATLPIDETERARFLALVAQRAPELAEKRVVSPSAVRRVQRELAARLAEGGVDEAVASQVARVLAELDAADLAEQLEPLLRIDDPMVAIGYLKQVVYVHKNAETVRRAIHQIQRIVRALKSYTHLDQQESLVRSDIHEGIENTLVLLDHELGGGISVTRKYGELKPVPIFVDELNQVWTNLIHNAVQALGGTGNITIETEAVDHEVVIRVIDDGQGVPPEVLPRIFEPFFTTKPKGQGTGLGLGIVRNIVAKHRGTVSASSEPGRTCFEVRLPVDGGAGAAETDRMTG